MCSRHHFSVCTAVAIILSVIGNITGIPVNTTIQAQTYLSQFGYLPASAGNSNSSTLIDASTWTEAVRSFQSFAGLNVTGDLNNETKLLMSLSRCGVKDMMYFEENNRPKRFALENSRWRKRVLSYRVSKYSRKLSRYYIDYEIARAFNVWSDVIDMSFTYIANGPVDIDIRFVNLEHGDGNAFDGFGGTLAHAYYPRYGGDAHFDDDENWTINSPQGTNFFQVAVHEFGHSLGLSHSGISAALMAPFYKGFEPEFELHSDDVQAIQALYGKKNIQTPKDMPREDLICKDPKVDAIFNSANQITYAFKGNKYYILTKKYIADGYPKLISEGWPGLPDDIDAAFTNRNGKTFFFKGTKYWRYNERRIDENYPKEISKGFPGKPNHLNAALVWDDSVYFFKGSNYWAGKSTYSRPISDFKGLPSDIDAAFLNPNGKTYFFKGGEYYRFNLNTLSVDAADPPFPRSSAHWWFGCENVPTPPRNFPENSEEEF